MAGGTAASPVSGRPKASDATKADIQAHSRLARFWAQRDIQPSPRTDVRLEIPSKIFRSDTRQPSGAVLMLRCPDSAIDRSCDCLTLLQRGLAALFDRGQHSAPVRTVSCAPNHSNSFGEFAVIFLQFLEIRDEGSA